MKKYLTLLICLFAFSSSVYAASECSYEEQVKLKEKAANINASYEVVEKKGYDDDNNEYTYNQLQVSILNVTEEFYVVIKDNQGSDPKTLGYENSNDGVISYLQEDVSKLYNYTIEVYTSDKTSCKDEKLKTLYLNLPKYNPFSRYDVCKDLEGFYLCDRYINVEDVSEEEFMKLVQEYKGKQTEEKAKAPSDNSLIDNIKEYKWYIVGGAILLVIITTGVVIIKKKKERNLK